ncbi:MAG: hypothetical protein FH762_12365 [Firmicutes bacterium]|nr:hypothetical protein [Bacillota bacterium]
MKNFIFVLIIVFIINGGVVYSIDSFELIESYEPENLLSSLTDLSNTVVKGREMLVLCSDQEELYLAFSNSRLLLSPPSFRKQVNDFVIRGYTNSDLGLCKIDNLNNYFRYGQNKMKFPIPLFDIAGFTYDGELYWVIDGDINILYSFMVIDKAGKKAIKINSKSLIRDLKVEGLDWYNGSLWLCDLDNVYKLNKNFEIIKTYKIPAKISGIHFYKGYLFATGFDKMIVYQFEIN